MSAGLLEAADGSVTNGKRQSAWKVACLVFVACGISVAIADLALPNYMTGLPRDTFLMGFAATPNSWVDDTPINSMGFTGDPVDLVKPAQTIRILTLGGSAMFNRRMTQRLKDGLNKVSSSHIEIVGGALRAHTTASSILKYKLLSKYRPDLILIYHGINDLWANHVSLEDFRADYSHLSPWYKRNVCLDHSAICRMIYNRWIHRKPPTVFRATFGDSPGRDVFRRNVMTLIDAARETGSTPILMTFAWTIPDNYSMESFKAGGLGYNNPTRYDSWPVELWGPERYVREGLEANNGAVSDLARANNVLLIDQKKLMGNDLHWFGDVCHLSEEGTDRFISNIVDFFVDQGLVKKPVSLGETVRGISRSHR